MNKGTLYQEVCAINEAVEMGGWRQWLEFGGGAKAKRLNAEIAFSQKELPETNLPKTLKIISKTLSLLVERGLHTSEALRHEAVSCYVCGGHAKLDDDHSPCPYCEATGVLWQGKLAKNAGWLKSASDGYLSLTETQREKDIEQWKMRLEL
jgi:hypothetical protein